MEIQTITIIIASIALAIALESTILIVWCYRKMSKQINSLRYEMVLPKDDLRLLVDKLTPPIDFPEEMDSAIDESPTVISSPSPDDGAPTDNSNDLLENAYNTFHLRYQELVDSITIDNLDVKSQEQAVLLLEMGYWLKDYLPVWHNDFNATSIQRENVNFIALDQTQWQRKLAEAPLPDNNPYKTPLEVIGLVKKMKQCQINDFRFLISGFRYQQNEE